MHRSSAAVPNTKNVMRKNIRVMSVIVFFVLFVLYAGFETVKLFLGPSLIVDSPKDLATISDPLITVSGTVKRVSYITINDRQIFADTEGKFSDKLLLQSGYNIIEVEVKDRFGKILREEIRVWLAP
jgi:hypothetical protein